MRYSGMKTKHADKPAAKPVARKPDANMVAALIFVEEECHRVTETEADGSAKEFASHLKGIVSEALVGNRD